MAFFFKKFPKIQYDLERDGFDKTIHNPLVRFKLKDILKSRTALYYTHSLNEGETAQFIAEKYYDDSTLDWVIYIVNDIIDPQYDMPLDYNNFVNYVKGKYGSVETAMSTVHHYEQIIQTQSVLYDGTIIPEKVIEVDATTYAGLAADEKREIDCYEYENRLNNDKKTIKILHLNYLQNFLEEAESIFE